VLAERFVLSSIDMVTVLVDHVPCSNLLAVKQSQTSSYELVEVSLLYEYWRHVLVAEKLLLEVVLLCSREIPGRS
jgi:hypothetical protein